MILIAVCDDNPLHLNHTKALLDDAAFDTPVHVRTYRTGSTLLSTFRHTSSSPPVRVKLITSAFTVVHTAPVDREGW